CRWGREHEKCGWDCARSRGGRRSMGMNQMQTVVSSLLLSCVGAFGQVQPPGTANQVQPPVANRGGASSGGGGGGMSGGGGQEEPLVLVEFGGGTLGDLVRVMSQTQPGKDANVVVSREAQGVEVPAMSLRNASMWAVLQAAAATADSTRGVLIVDRVSKGPGEFETYTVQFQARGTIPGMAPTVPVVVRVASVADVIEAGGADSAATLLSALTATLEMDGGLGGQAADVKFHKESSLLIVRGTEAQQATAKQVIEQLRGAGAKRLSREQRMKMAAERRDRLQAEAQDSRRRVEVVTQELETFLKQFKDGVPSSESPRYTMMKAEQVSAIDAMHEVEARLMDARLKEQDSGMEASDDEVSELKKQIKILEAERAELRRFVETFSEPSPRKGK
ncbi:MAG: hypothetical protein NTV94_14060, partial [Planctomycetota bacterium]|nr:hypothetical protein [Planctomycetota bacterium]